MFWSHFSFSRFAEGVSMSLRLAESPHFAQSSSMTTMDEQQEAKRRKLEALEAKMGGAPPPQAVRPAKMPNLPAVAPTPVSSAPTAAGAS